MDSPTVKARLRLAIILTSLILCAEAIGGVLANSLALLSDAAHMFTDVFSLSLSWFALKIADRPSTQTKTYGYHRLETFAALINGGLLFLMAGGILYEAVQRMMTPKPVDTGLMMIIAAIGLITNLGVIYFLREPAKNTQDLNIKSALYHVFGDTLASIGVILGGVVMLWTGWYILDAILGAAIAGLLLWGAKSIFGDAVHILLEGVPKDISIPEVEKELNAIPEIKSVHELHIWCICSNVYALSTHLLINDQKVNQAGGILDTVQDMLREKFNITHSTIQFESSPCQEENGVCEIKH